MKTSNMKTLDSSDYSKQIRHADEISRRNFMHKMVNLFGVTTATAVLSGCTVPVAKKIAEEAGQENRQTQTGQLFSDHQATILYSICETILPKTDTLSATEVGCHQFVPHQLTYCHSKQQQDDCIQVIDALDKLANQRFGKALPLLTSQQQQQLLDDFEGTNVSTSDEKNQFRFLKAIIVFGYFTSEPGATEALNYQMVPGGFVGSIKITAETKAWGAMDYY